MIPITPAAASSIVSPIALVITLTSTPLVPTSPDIPVLEVVKVYGRLAGPNCYGMKAPPGSSCQIQLADLKRALGLEDELSSQRLSRDEFASKLEQLDFQWPLKPYGVEKSLSKTAVMNKGAETRVFMDELEGRGLYDRRNPTGPLPTSLRPALNKKLQSEGLESRVVDLVFQSFTSGSLDGRLSAEQVDGLFQGREEIDYYDFLKAIGTDAVLWPN